MAGRRALGLGVAVLVLLMLAGSAAPDASSAGPRPNLQELRVTAPAGTVEPGARVTAFDLLRNAGRGTAGRSTVAFLLSRNHRLDTGDVRLGSRAVKRLRGGTRSRGRKLLRLPATLEAGAWRLLGCADHLRRVRESNERDNCAVARGTVTVAAPDPGGEPERPPPPGPEPEEPGPRPPGPPPPPPGAVPVTLAAPTDGAVTNAFAIRFSGSAAAGAMVTVVIHAGTSAAGVPRATLEALPDADGAWSATADALAPGTYTAQARQTDAFGRTQTSAAHTFRVDRAPPGVAITSPADGSTTADTTPTVSGSAGAQPGDETTVTVRIYRGGASSSTVVAELAVSRQGASFAATPASALADGLYTARAEQRDSAGNAGTSEPVSFQVDHTGPTVNLVTPASGSAVKSALFSGTGGSAPGDAASVTITVRRQSDDAVVQTVSAPRSGASFSAAASPPLADGTYVARAEQADASGNTGTSAPHEFRVDNGAPAVAVADPPDTRDTTPTFSGSAGTAPGDSPTVTVRVRSAGGGTVVATQETIRSGPAWSLTVNSTLPDGSYTVQASQADSAGNSGSSGQPGFRVDTQAPAPTIASPAAGATVPGARPTLSGAAGSSTGDSATVTVRLYRGSGTSGTLARTLTATRSGGTWSATPGSALAAGTYTAVAEQEDALGNSGQSAPRTFTVDPAGPNVTLTQPSGGHLTNDVTPSFGGAAGSAPDDLPTVTLKIYAGDTASGSPVQTRTVSGSPWTVAADPALADGTYTAQAEQSDSAGNVGRSGAVTFHVDSTSPTVAITLDPANPDGATGSGWYRTMPRVHVTADDAHFDTLACSVDGADVAVTPTPGSTHDAEGDVPVSGDGSHTVTCTATDRAGTPAATATRQFKVDRAAPAVELTTPANGATTNLMSFAGASGSGGIVTLRVWAGSGTSGTPLRSQTTPPSGGNWSLTLAPVLDHGATYTVRAEQGDAAGNVGRSAAHTFTVPHTLLAAGDIAGCAWNGDELTAGVLAERAGTIATLGDNIYADGQTAPEGSLANFMNCYEPSWGAVKPRTRPSVGNHEYRNAGAAGYFEYFGAAARQDQSGYYSYDVGSWHVIVLNTNNNCSSGLVSCAAGSPQETWLRNDLANSASVCTVAYFHHPRFSSYLGTNTNVRPLWNALYDGGVELVLNGHAHTYERFKPMKPDGTLDPEAGIRQIIAGTGGAPFHNATQTAANSEPGAFNNSASGILELELGSGGYSWRFADAPGGGTFSDSGSASCHGAPAAP